AEALALFVAAGEGTRRFRAESRRAEWGLRAEDPERAREAAWLAVKAAELRRDRRYALTLLVEAYRADDTLADLIDRLASADTLTSEERELWIDQLREQSRYDEAIELFRSGADGNLTRPMRRELLEMEREAGHEDRMIAEYEALIAREPGEVIWRTGLTQLLLERGDEDAAAALWPDYIATLATGGPLLESLAAQVSLGLDDLAVATVDRMLELDVDSGEALLALARMHRDRGRLPEAEAALDRLNASVDASDSVRFELAESYEQLGRQRRAVEVMEGVRGQRETVAEDLEMRLAWLYSEISEEKQALALWKQLWQRVNSVPRRRYVEDRLMSVASRLGSLADIAIDLEEKLIEGTADERDVGLLVRIYTRVNDPVSATEVLGDFMRQSGGSEIDVLAEESRIYLVCTDYHNYEKTIRRMIDVDPEGEGDYLRQLAMSQLERGRPDQARDVLMQLRDIETDSVSREFEGGVLTLAGMHEEACVAYRKGVAEHPDRIESYLLLADLMRTLGQTPRAVGMFQYLAETAERDDLFTIAIDGLLNMEADGATIQWARRITLERLAGREDKNYLYQLLHDLAEESGDKPAQIRALENSIAVAGTRRLSVLRECMDLSSRVRGGVFSAPGQNGPTNAGNEPFYAFARRLIGLEEAVPPGVFLDLGQAFLADDNVRSAWQTFS
ncbi:MAG: tetratricopeptide repeat protein, partial [Planctomycetota bacterium]